MCPDVRLHDPLAFHGRVELVTVESELLRGNPLGDPATRELPVYLPPGWDSPGVELPVVFVLAGFGGRGQNYLETHPWRRGPVWRYDRAVADGIAAPAILVLPDCFTALGGSQYVNSPAVGRYADHVVDELVPLVDGRYPVRAGRRGVTGKSSGGFGALHLAMRHPGVFAASASISGDCGFEAVFAGELLACVRGLTRRGVDPRGFLEEFRREADLAGDGHAVINVLAMSACYSPEPGSELGFALPVDLRTGERVREVWERWLEFDPLCVAEKYVEELRALDWLHLECGLGDEYHIQWGTRRLVMELRRLGLEVSHEEHEGGHRGIDHRYAWVIDRMAGVLGG